MKIILFILIILTNFCTKLQFRDPISPTYKGIINIPKGYLQDNVEIFREENGVPHIVAQNFKDLYFAQGFIIAQDRYIQLQITARLVSSTLSELIESNESILSDKKSFMFGYLSRAEKEWEEIQKNNPEDAEYLIKFCEGINTFAKLHPEVIYNLPEYLVGLKMGHKSKYVEFKEVYSIAINNYYSFIFNRDTSEVSKLKKN
jgi:penicillin G amidase